MKRGRWLASGSAVGCTGCLGALGVGGLAVGALVVVAGFVTYSIQQEWEATVHQVLADATGGEVDFAGLRIGWGRVTLVDLEVRDSTGEPLLVVGRLTVHASPLDLLDDPDSWSLTGLSLREVLLTPHRTPDGLAVPTATLALLRGERSDALQGITLPDLVVPEVTLDGVLAQLDGLSVELESARVPTGGSLVLDPVAVLTLGVVELEGLTASGPGVATAATARATLAAPLAATATGLSLTEVAATGLSVELDALIMTADTATATEALPLTWSDGEPAVVPGAWQVESVVVQGGNRATLARLEVVAREPLSLATERVVLDELRASTVRASPGEQGFGLVDHVFSASAAVPPLEVSRLELGDVVLSVPGAAAAVASASTSLSLTPGERVGWGAITLSEVAVRVGDDERVQAATASVRSGSLARADDVLELGTVTVRDAVVRAAWGEQAFGIPPELFRIGGVKDGVVVDVLDVSGLDLAVAGATGTLPVTASRARVDQLEVRPGHWGIAGADLSGVSADDGKRRATATRVTLRPGGVVEVGTAEVWTRLGRERTLDLPPVARDHTPTWLGGGFAGKGTFFGVSFPGTPWVPVQLSAPKLTVHVVDAGIATTTTTWDVPMQVTLGPHRKNGNLPITLSGTFAGGTFAGKGHLEADGTVELDLDAEKLKLRKLGAYVDEPLERFGLEVEKGQAAADLHLTLNGSVARMKGTGTAKNLELGGSALAGVANLGFDVLKGKDNAISMPIDVKGDLSDPSFSLIDAVIASYTRGIGKGLDLDDLEGAGAAVDDLLDSVSGGGKGKGKGKGGKGKGGKASSASSDLEDAVDDLSNALSGALGGGKKSGGKGKGKGKGKGGK